MILRVIRGHPLREDSGAHAEVEDAEAGARHGCPSANCQGDGGIPDCHRIDQSVCCLKSLSRVLCADMPKTIHRPQCTAARLPEPTLQSTRAVIVPTLATPGGGTPVSYWEQALADGARVALAHR